MCYTDVDRKGGGIVEYVNEDVSARLLMMVVHAVWVLCFRWYAMDGHTCKAWCVTDRPP